MDIAAAACPIHPFKYFITSRKAFAYLNVTRCLLLLLIKIVEQK
jgi:hypothetical protein